MSTILHRLVAWADSDPSSTAQSVRVIDPKTRKPAWKAISAREFCDRVYWLALYLESRGMTSDDIGTLFSYNCPQWVHMELAGLLLGAKSTGIYPNSVSKDILYVLEHTESRFLAVQNAEYYRKLTANGSVTLPSRLKIIIVFEGDASFSTKAVTYEKAIAEGKQLAAARKKVSIHDYLQKLDPHAGAFMIYTSGTTGTPKGAVLTHDNLVFTVDAVIKHWKIRMGGGSLFSFLPLCHVAEKLQNIGASISQRYNVYYCSRFENVSAELPEAEPTLLLCVPRVWEKMMEGVMKKVSQGSLPKRALASWAFNVGAAQADQKKKPGLHQKLQYRLAERLVLSKVRAGLGLAQAEALASGAAPLLPNVAKWFRSIGLEINEDYGQTESTGVICMTTLGTNCIGSVGEVAPGIRVKIAEDGEILTQGRHVFQSYFKDQQATQKVLEGGWLHTGDLGEFDDRNFLRIRGRKKEVLKTSGGKMVAPLPIEEALKAYANISQVCLVGDGQKFMSALITLSESKLSELQGHSRVSSDTTITSPQVVTEVRKYVDEVNSALPSYEQIKKFAILSKDFSINEGEMTPTLKMKRNVVENRYRDLIQTFYS